MMCYLRVITASAINIPSVIIGGEKQWRLTSWSSAGRACCQTAVTADGRRYCVNWQRFAVYVGRALCGKRCRPPLTGRA